MPSTGTVSRAHCRRSTIPLRRWKKRISLTCLPVTESEDRTRASADGRTFTRQAWSTPLAGHHQSHGHRIFTLGRGVWGGGRSETAFTYLELELDAIGYNVDDAEQSEAHVRTAGPAAR